MENSSKLILFLLLLFACNVSGQQDHKISEQLINHKITSSGGKVAFFKNNSTNVELIIKDLKRKKEYSLKGISGQTVLNEEALIGLNPAAKKLYRIIFKSGKIDSVNNVSDFHWNEKFNLTVSHHKNEQKLLVSTAYGDTVKVLEGVKFYSVSQNADKLLAVSADNGITWYDMAKRKVSQQQTEYLDNYTLKRILWSGTDSVYALYNSKSEITVLNLTEHSQRKVGAFNIVQPEKAVEVDTLFTKARLIDGYVALGAKLTVDRKQNTPKIWSGAAKGIPEKKAQQLANVQQLLLVKIADGSLLDLSEQGKLIDMRVAAYKDIIFSWEIDKYEDFTREHPLKELYWYDLNSKEKKKLGFFSEGSVPLVSFENVPYYVYFKQGDWYLFDLENQTSKNITAGSCGIYYNEQFQYLKNSKEGYLSLPVAFNNTIVIEEKQEVYMYDYKSHKLKTITDGKETGRSYSVQWDGSEHKLLGWDLNFSKSRLDHDGLLLKWHTDDYREEGISIVGSDGKIRDVVKDTARFSQIRRSGNFISFIKEKANLPPQLSVVDFKAGKTQTLYQSNEWDTESKSIKVDYLKWKDDTGRLTGTLVRFPLNYDKNKKYPAVFRIYQSKKQNRNMYEDPLESFGTGFNYRDYISDGYFVIEPDISYEVGKPGRSALICVEDAFDRVVATYGIDTDRVGICGHSFGGYETNFIITQTERFKAAASSAGVFDLESFYLTINWETLKPDMWRMESQQWRMGKGMYEDRDAYRKNSPANFLENITTPLLLVTGERDFQIDWQQSVKMFLAMKRLNKEVNLLLYPNEAHSLIKIENKKDFSDRMKQWFDFKLKNKIKPVWIEEGLQ